MSASEQPNLPAKSQYLVCQAEDGQVKIDVRLHGETAWLTQAHMAELFQTTVPNISIHLRNNVDTVIHKVVRLRARRNPDSPSHGVVAV